MAQIQPVQVATLTTQAEPINGITFNDVKDRTKSLSQANPIDQAAPMRDITFYATVRNNIMLDKIIENQNKIMQKLGIGENLNVKG